MLYTIQKKLYHTEEQITLSVDLKTTAYSYVFSVKNLLPQNGRFYDTIDNPEGRDWKRSLEFRNMMTNCDIRDVDKGAVHS